MTRAEWALNLLQTEHFLEMFAELKEIEVNKIVSSDADELGKRENAYLMINAYNQIYSSIEAMAADKKIIEKRWKIF